MGDMLAQQAMGIAQIARTTGLSRQTVYRIKDDPASAEAALVARPVAQIKGKANCRRTK